MVLKRANYWLTVMVLGVWLTESVMSKCTQEGPCKCRTDKGMIDLTPFNRSVPAFKDVQDEQNSYLFSYSPCIPFSDAGCKDVSVCQLTPDHFNFYPAGTVDSAKWDTDGSGAYTITYNQTDWFSNLRTTVVTLNCTRGKDQLIVHGEVAPLIYIMTLQSVHCCDNPGHSLNPGPTTTHGPNDEGSSSGNLSAGTVTCIVVVVLVVVFIAGGIAFQKGVRKAQGKETFPNHNFWSDIPSLIKDRFSFIFTGGKRRSGYDRV